MDVADYSSRLLTTALERKSDRDARYVLSGSTPVAAGDRAAVATRDDWVQWRTGRTTGLVRRSAESSGTAHPQTAPVSHLQG